MCIARWGIASIEREDMGMDKEDCSDEWDVDLFGEGYVF